jgi:hypothetical protein
MVLALNTVSGQIGDVSPKMLLHPQFKDILVPVDENAKPYNSALYKPGTVEEKLEQRAAAGLLSFGKRKKAKKEEPIEIVEETELLTIEEVFEPIEVVFEEQETESNIDIEEEN